MQTGQRLKEAADVLLEPHIWLGQGAVVLKGVVLSLGSVVGAQPLVLQRGPSFSVIGGCGRSSVNRTKLGPQQAPSLLTLEVLNAIDKNVGATPVHV
jgi:acetyltransferase-like isoleucine patch superfamily enzyme